MAFLLAQSDRFSPCTAFADVGALTAAGAPPCLVVLDLYLGRDDVCSVDAIPALRASGAEVVVFTSEERPAPLRAAVAVGASGLVLKNDGMKALAVALEAAALNDGDFSCSSLLAEALLGDPKLVAGLTNRESEVLCGLQDGLTARQVAKRLGIEEATVRTHQKSVREKYMALGRDVTNTISIIRDAQGEGSIDARLHRSRSPIVGSVLPHKCL